MRSTRIIAFEILLIESLFGKEGNYEICAVCLTAFVAGEGVLGDPEGMDELNPEDRITNL